MRKNTSFSDRSSILRNNRGGVTKLAWEWRIFWHHNAGDRSKFDDFSILDNKEPEDIAEEENEDIYILLPGCEHLNLKLRENKVSVKYHYAAFAAFNAYQKKTNLCLSDFAKRILAAYWPVRATFDSIRGGIQTNSCVERTAGQAACRA
jgi:hypothetical protein